jgi:hypothetical protein
MVIGIDSENIAFVPPHVGQNETAASTIQLVVDEAHGWLLQPKQLTGDMPIELKRLLQGGGGKYRFVAVGAAHDRASIAERLSTKWPASGSKGDWLSSLQGSIIDAPHKLLKQAMGIHSRRYSIKFLLPRVCGVWYPKAIDHRLWGRRDLAKRQVEYAVTDALAHLAIWAKAVEFVGGAELVKHVPGLFGLELLPPVTFGHRGTAEDTRDGAGEVAADGDDTNVAIENVGLRIVTDDDGEECGRKSTTVPDTVVLVTANSVVVEDGEGTTLESFPLSDIGAGIDESDDQSSTEYALELSDDTDQYTLMFGSRSDRDTFVEAVADRTDAVTDAGTDEPMPAAAPVTGVVAGASVDAPTGVDTLDAVVACLEAAAARLGQVGGGSGAGVADDSQDAEETHALDPSTEVYAAAVAVLEKMGEMVAANTLAMDAEVELPAALSGGQRLALHRRAEPLNVYHASSGAGDRRRMTLSATPTKDVEDGEGDNVLRGVVESPTAGRGVIMERRRGEENEQEWRVRFEEEDVSESWYKVGQVNAMLLRAHATDRDALLRDGIAESDLRPPPQLIGVDHFAGPEYKKLLQPRPGWWKGIYKYDPCVATLLSLPHPLHI